MMILYWTDGNPNSYPVGSGEVIISLGNRYPILHLQVEGNHMDPTRPVATVASVRAHLEDLKVALQGVGGRIEVVDVKQGVCVIKFRVRTWVVRSVMAGYHHPR